MFRKATALILALILCCASLVACKKEPIVTMEEFLNASIPLEREYRGVSFTIEDATTKGASFRYVNRNEVIVLVSCSWDPFINTDSGYQYVRHKKNFPSVDCLHGEPQYQYLDFKLLYKKLKPGAYRVVIKFEFPDGNMNDGYGHKSPDNHVYLYADFTVS